MTGKLNRCQRGLFCIRRLVNCFASASENLIFSPPYHTAEQKRRAHGLGLESIKDTRDLIEKARGSSAMVGQGPTQT